MRAMVCKSLDGPEHLELRDVPEPVGALGHVIVRVTAVGLNFADTLITRGKYQFKPDLPFSPGAEIAGVIQSVGPGVSGWSAGHRVMAYVNWGGACEKILVDARALVAVPDAVPDVIAAGLSVTYGTAMHGLIERGRLAAGETVVVTGAAGGAGQAAIDIAKRLGARVIAVASSAEKLALAAARGADDGIMFPGTDLKETVKAKTGGAGADIVYDCVGGEASEPLVRALAWRGRLLVVGFAAGEIPKIPLNLLLLKGAEISGVFWGEAVKRDPVAHARNMEQVLSWVAKGTLCPSQPTTFALAQMSDALGLLERRAAHGKLVIAL